METVTHSRFGKGTVISRMDGKITVDFETEGTKVLLEKFTKFNTPTKKSNGQKKRERAAKEMQAHNALSNLEKIKSSILGINNTTYGDTNSSSYSILLNVTSSVQQIADENGNDFISGIINTVQKTARASEKQAYCIARFADENGIKV